MKRALSLDVLRGLSIFGMVLSGTIPFGGGLPAWMFHAQCPPPTYVFNPEVAGITWVDLVLPFFIFCMGVAIPLALNRKIINGDGFKEIGTLVFTRFFSLVFFAIYIIHILPDSIGKGFWNIDLFGQKVQGYDLQLLTLVGFALMFPMFRIIKDKKRRIFWRIIGWGGALVLLLLFRLVYGQVFSLHRSDIIIVLLANVYLLAALGWYFTRNSWLSRFALFGFFATVQLSCKYTGFNEVIDSFEPVSWFFVFRMTHYILLIIPATVVGDLLLKRLQSPTETIVKPFDVKWQIVFHVGLALLVVWLTIALFRQWLTILYVTVPLLLLGFFLIMKKYFPEYKQLFLLAAYLIVIGLIIEPVEGGIKKDDVTASYMLITSGMALCMLMFFDYICQIFEQSAFVKLFAKAGSNPLLIYVVTSWFMFPFLKASFSIGIYDWFYPSGYPWVGVVRALVFVLGMMVLVYWSVKRKIIWRA